MDLKKLLKNDYVRLAILAIVAYLVYRYFFVVREGLVNGQGLEGSRVDPDRTFQFMNNILQRIGLSTDTLMDCSPFSVGCHQ